MTTSSIESNRLAEVRRYEILDTEPELALDRITEVVAKVFGVPIALVTIVDEDRIWFKSRFGLDVGEIGRDPGLCASAIEQRDVWVVGDARSDPRTVVNPLVTGALGLQFYAGVPLRTSTSMNLGTLCLIDHVPRDFCDEDRALLRLFGALVVDVLDLRLTALRLVREQDERLEMGRKTADELQAALLERTRTEQAHALLADVTGLMLGAQTAAEALPDVARRSLPTLGVGCGISLMDEAGFRTVAVAHTNPGAETILGVARDRSADVNLDHPPPLASHVLTTGQPLVCSLEEGLQWPGTPEVPGLEEMLREAGVGWFLLAPMVARDRAIGVVTFLASATASPFDEHDTNLAMTLAHRMAEAIDNDRIHGEQARIAETLQRSLLPPFLPVIPSVDLSANYRPAGDSEVGGDFYDVFVADSDSWLLLLGDVSGKGPEAAAIAGLARYTARALGLDEHQPSRILEQMNTVIGRQSNDGKFLTAVCARITPQPHGAVHLTIADAGHPPPLIRRADGSVEQLHLDGTILGVFPQARVAETTVELARDEAIVFYTDGATDARNAAGEFLGVEGLAAALAGIPQRRAANLTHHLMQAVERVESGRPRDDIAILVVRASA